jgi:hypothetical protein
MKEKGKRQRRGKRKNKERGGGILKKEKETGRERESNRVRKGRRHKLLPVTNIAVALIEQRGFVTKFAKVPNVFAQLLSNSILVQFIIINN